LLYSCTPTPSNTTLPELPLLFLYIVLHIILHLYMPSKGRVSLKQESHTSFTAFTAITSSLQNGRVINDLIALERTQFWCCCVICQLFLVKNSLAHLHSPLKLEALIYRAISIIQACMLPAIHTSAQAACLKSAQSTFHLK
jgi:hypothetical protein